MYTLTKLSQQINGGRLTRTERVLQQQEYEKIRREEQLQAEAASQDFSGVTTIEEYREKYDALPSNLKPYFSTPAEIEAQQETSRLESISKINQQIEDNKRRIAEYKQKRNAGGVSYEKKQRYDDKIDVLKEKNRALIEAREKGASFSSAKIFATKRGASLSRELKTYQRDIIQEVTLGREGEITSYKVKTPSGDILKYEEFAPQRQQIDIRPKTPMDISITASKIGEIATTQPTLTLKSLFKTKELPSYQQQNFTQLFTPAPDRFPTQPISPKLVTTPSSREPISLPSSIIFPGADPSTITMKEALTPVKFGDPIGSGKKVIEVWRGVLEAREIQGRIDEQSSSIGGTYQELYEISKPIVGPFRPGEPTTKEEALGVRYNEIVSGLNKEIESISGTEGLTPEKRTELAGRYQEAIEIKKLLDGISNEREQLLSIRSAELGTLGVTQNRVLENGTETIKFTSKELETDLRSFDVKVTEAFEREEGARRVTKTIPRYTFAPSVGFLATIKPSEEMELPIIGGAPLRSVVYGTARVTQEVGEGALIGVAIGGTGALVKLQQSQKLVQLTSKFPKFFKVGKGVLTASGVALGGYQIGSSTIKGYEEGLTIGDKEVAQRFALFSGLRTGGKVAGLVGGTILGSQIYQQQQLIDQSTKEYVSRTTRAGETSKEFTKATQQTRTQQFKDGSQKQVESILKDELKKGTQLQYGTSRSGGVVQYSVRDTSTGDTRIVEWTPQPSGKYKVTTYLFKSKITGVAKITKGTQVKNIYDVKQIGRILKTSEVTGLDLPGSSQRAFRGVVSLEKGKVFTPQEFAFSKRFFVGRAGEEVTQFPSLRNIQLGGGVTITQEVQSTKGFITKSTGIVRETRPVPPPKDPVVRAIFKLAGKIDSNQLIPGLKTQISEPKIEVLQELKFNQLSKNQQVILQKEIGKQLISPQILSQKIYLGPTLQIGGTLLGATVLQRLTQQKELKKFQRGILSQQLLINQIQQLSLTQTQLAPQVSLDLLGRLTTIQQPQLVTQTPIPTTPVTPPTNLPQNGIPGIPLIPYLPGGGGDFSYSKKKKVFYTKAY